MLPHRPGKHPVKLGDSVVDSPVFVVDARDQDFPQIPLFEAIKFQQR